MTYQNRKIAGIVLVGGQSSRMGQNKSLLLYQGNPLFKHMEKKLIDSGVHSVFFSGYIEGQKNCIPDPLTYQGPGHALGHVITTLYQQFTHLLVVAVDTPRLTPKLLQQLIMNDSPCHFVGHPLPAFFMCQPVVTSPRSVYALLESQHAVQLPIQSEDESYLKGANTPDEWEEIIR